MFGPRIGTVFASRYRALWWAAVVLVTAYCSIPSQEETAARTQHAAAQDHAAAGGDDAGSGKARDDSAKADLEKAEAASAALRKLLE